MPKTSRLVWDKVGEHFFETGVDHGVLYLIEKEVYSKAVPWNGLISVTETPSGAEPTAMYADNIKYLNLRSAEDFGCTIEAYTYPDEFEECDGSAELAKGVTIGQQGRKTFGFSYRTMIGNDLVGTDFGYKLHLVYGATCSPSEKNFNSVNDNPEANTFSWEVTTTPVQVKDYKPTSIIIIDSTKVDPSKLKQLEDILYGTDAEDEGYTASLPLPDEVMKIFAEG